MYHSIHFSKHYVSFRNSSPLLISAEEFENAALYLRLDLPAPTVTLIRHESGAFRKPFFKPEEFENAGFAF